MFIIEDIGGGSRPLAQPAKVLGVEGIILGPEDGHPVEGDGVLNMDAGLILGDGDHQEVRDLIHILPSGLLEVVDLPHLQLDGLRVVTDGLARLIVIGNGDRVGVDGHGL